MFFLIVISIFSFDGKAQYYYPGPYQQNIIIQRQDLGIYGYGYLQQEIMLYGIRLRPGLYQQRLRSPMNLLGRQMLVDKVRTLQLSPRGSYISTDLYLNGFSVGRTEVIGRIATTTLYRQNIERAMYQRRY